MVETGDPHSAGSSPTPSGEVGAPPRRRWSASGPRSKRRCEHSKAAGGKRAQAKWQACMSFQSFQLQGLGGALMIINTPALPSFGLPRHLPLATHPVGTGLLSPPPALLPS